MVKEAKIANCEGLPGPLFLESDTSSNREKFISDPKCNPHTSSMLSMLWGCRNPVSLKSMTAALHDLKIIRI